MKKLLIIVLLFIVIKAFHVSQVNALSANTINVSDTLPPSNVNMRPSTMFKDSVYSKDSSKIHNNSTGTTPNYNENILKQNDSTANQL